MVVLYRTIYCYIIFVNTWFYYIENIFYIIYVKTWLHYLCQYIVILHKTMYLYIICINTWLEYIEQYILYYLCKNMVTVSMSIHGFVI